MGHVRLGNLPRTRKWNQVVELLKEGAGTPQVAAASLDASEAALKKAANDQGLIHSAWLLTQMVQAARSGDFSDNLRNLGLSVSDAPSLLEIVGAFTSAADNYVRSQRSRSDIGEMGQMAAVETITALVGQESQNLFGTTTDDVKQAFNKFSTTKNFGEFSREFFSRFAKRYLSYFLSRTLSNHVGGEGRFLNINEHVEFNKALETHCREASKIVQEFSGGWFSKTRFEQGEITQEKAAGYVYFCLEKLRREFSKGAKSDE